MICSSIISGSDQRHRDGDGPELFFLPPIDKRLGVSDTCFIMQTTLNRQVRTFRKTANPPTGWTQEQLAQRLKVSVATVARWEAGVHQPSPMALERLKHMGFSG